MVSVTVRTDKQTYSVRVVVKVKRKHIFSLTFDDWDAAVDWAEEHEERVLADPEWYMNWKAGLAKQMRRSNLKVKDHIIRPRVKV